ncbi:GMC family oxidoreductase [Gloeocapsopsis sp. IPPAS B-1203]|uniref:FAD-dependent oxidoreductase n=1 Tax=Gloeocapsopsis sp. IPPAS B-1203 TaxID=2049454 RepID=UPI000C1A2734|nr:GMC family oxidoreductase [Gloeocapsopsis sp. IPPAS B-1203]PIG93902.1 GMC oxidoreductase [Gloeocapsopsis sp. IPPAS B-1203]
MLIDARTIPTDEIIKTEVCIIGAGPAGITLARELIGQNFRVCLLESGQTEPPDEDLQSLCKGEIIDELYQDLSLSLCRQFGGAANFWHNSVRLLPLDKIDFEKRDGLPYSGWPFSKSHLDPFYERAQHLCRLRPFAYDAEDWEDEQTPRLPFTGSRIATTTYQFSPRKIFTHELRSEIRRSENITTYLNANVVEIETDDIAKTVTRVRVACFQGNGFWVKAKVFILATGGIENVRLLLLSNKTQNVGLGNQHDLVGRFFMEHPVVRLGMFIPSERQIFNSAGLYDIRWTNNIPVMGKLSLTEEVMRRQQLLNSYLLLVPKSIYESPAIKSLKVLLSSIRHAKVPKDLLQHLNNAIGGIDEIVTRIYRRASNVKEFPYDISHGGWSHCQGNEKRFRAFQVWSVTEQPPNPDIRVMLSDERDRLGLRKIQPLRWHWSDLEIHSLQQVQEILREEIEHAGLGQFQSLVTLDRRKPKCVGGRHHMGTTRMHIDPKQGVVDENCRVHGVSNLFITGSSVFPTGGAANPTLTIIALAIRLADRVKTVMASTVMASDAVAMYR